MNSKIFKQIFKKIKRYETIVIARHVGADPDALGSSFGLKEIIQTNFPTKKVYVIGYPASKFRYLGELDKFNEELYKNSLFIVLDTPDRKRIDGADPSRFDCSVKIDHHPFIDKTCEIELIDETASSASQLVIELAFKNKMKIPSSAAEKLFIGLVADTNRFLFYYTTPKTFDLVSKLIKETNIEFAKLYDNLYFRTLKEIKFEGYIAHNLKVTENGFGYLNITNDILEKYEVDAATAGNMVNNFNYIEEVLVWGIFSEDKNNGNVRGSIRSRGPIINEVASHFNGGGHIYASGVRLTDFDEAELITNELDLACKEYKENLKK